MTVEYWPPSEYRCWNDRHQQLHPDGTLHFHCTNDQQVIEAYQYAHHVAVRSYQRFCDYPHLPHTLLGPPFGIRNVCISGPLGLLKGIK